VGTRGKKASNNRQIVSDWLRDTIRTAVYIPRLVKTALSIAYYFLQFIFPESVTLGTNHKSAQRKPVVGISCPESLKAVRRENATQKLFKMLSNCGKNYAELGSPIAKEREGHELKTGINSELGDKNGGMTAVVRLADYGLVILFAVLLAVSGPRFYGAIPYQAILLATAALLFVVNKDRRGLMIVLVSGASWLLLIAPSILANMENASDAFKMARHMAIIPWVALLFGFLMARVEINLLTTALVFGAAINLILMFFSASSSTEAHLSMYGQVIRVYWNIVTDEEIRATGMVSNCIAGFVMAAWIGWPTRFVYRAGFAALLAGALMFGLFTGTRSLAAAAVLVLLFRYASDLTSRRRLGRLVTMPVTLLLAGFVLINALPTDSFYFLDRFEWSALFDSSFSGRDEVWTDRWAMVQQRPVGYGNLDTVVDTLASSHNLVLEMMFLVGIVPGILFGALLGGVSLYCAVQLYRRVWSEKKRCLGTAVLIVALFSMFEASISSSYQAFLWTMIVIGAFFGVRNEPASRSGVVNNQLGIREIKKTTEPGG
jgi:O-antigen ligase